MKACIIHVVDETEFIGFPLLIIKEGEQGEAKIQNWSHALSPMRWSLEASPEGLNETLECKSYFPYPSVCLLRPSDEL